MAIILKNKAAVDATVPPPPEGDMGGGGLVDSGGFDGGIVPSSGGGEKEENDGGVSTACFGATLGAISSGILASIRLLIEADVTFFAGLPALSMGLLTTLVGVLGKISGGMSPFFFCSAEYVTTTLPADGFLPFASSSSGISDISILFAQKLDYLEK